METPRHWRLRGQRYGLVGEVCEHCGAKIFPARDVCPNCEDLAYKPFQFSGRGEVYSFSTVYQAPQGYEEYAPYTVALVKLEEGPLVTGQLTDMKVGDARIGMHVEMVTRKIREESANGAIIYGYKFRPVLQSAR